MYLGGCSYTWADCPSELYVCETLEILHLGLFHYLMWGMFQSAGLFLSAAILRLSSGRLGDKDALCTS